MYDHDLDKCKNFSDDILLKQCADLAQFYDTDLQGADLASEILDCRTSLKSRKEVVIRKPTELLQFIVSYGDVVFPNLRVSLQILLTI